MKVMKVLQFLSFSTQISTAINVRTKDDLSFLYDSFIRHTFAAVLRKCHIHSKTNKKINKNITFNKMYFYLNTILNTKSMRFYYTFGDVLNFCS